MISTLLVTLLVSVTIASLVSLADSALRARNSWVAICREMAPDAGQITRANVSFERKRPVVVPLRSAAANARPAPRLPQAVAA